MKALVEQAWHAYGGRVLAYLRRRLGGDGALAQDLVQECFLRLQRSGSVPANMEAWLYRTARNLVIDQARSRRPAPAQVLAEHSVPTQDGPAEAGREALLECLPLLLQGLPTVYGEALRRAYLQGLSQQALAAEQGLSLSGAKSRVQRARRLLRGAYEACCALEYDAQGRVMGLLDREGCVFSPSSSS